MSIEAADALNAKLDRINNLLRVLQAAGYSGFELDSECYLDVLALAAEQLPGIKEAAADLAAQAQKEGPALVRRACLTSSRCQLVTVS